MGGGGGDNEIKETSQEKAVADVAMKEYNRYQQTFVPLENDAMSNARVTAGERNQVVGETAGLTNVRFDNAQRNVTANVAPGAGRFTMATGNLNAQRGTGVSRAMTTAGNIADDTDLAGLSTSVDMGRGQATEAELGLSNIAARSANKANSDAFRDWRQEDDTNTAIGGVVGMVGYDQYKRKK